MGPLTRTQKWIAGLSLAAGLMHGGLSPQHFEEWWAYGVFFAAAAAAQMLFGLAVLTHALEAIEARHAWTRRAFYAAGALGNAALFGMYVVSRTIGVPLGPGAGDIEAVALLDVATKVFEAVIIVLCLWEARK